jgi:hypothetical protein
VRGPTSGRATGVTTGISNQVITRESDKRPRCWSTMRFLCLLHLGAAAACALVASPASAQREQLSIRAEQFGRADAQTTPGGFPRDFFETQQLTLTAALRSIRGTEGNTVLINGIFYRRTSLRTSRIPGGDPMLHAVYYDFLALRTLDDRHTLAVALRPGLFGNLEGEIGQQFRVEGATFIDRIVTPRTTLGVGLSYTSNFGRVLPVPVVHLVHRRGRKVLIDGLLPSRFDVWYFPRKGIELGLNAQLSGFQYYYSENITIPLGAGLGGVRASTRGGESASVEAPQIQLANATIGPQLRWNAIGKFYVSAEAGTTIVRRYTFGTGNDERAINPGRATFARLGVQRMF